jgi:hypothetical protein
MLLERSLRSKAGSAGGVSLSCGFALRDISPAVPLLRLLEHKI